MLMGGESSGELVIFPIESFYSLREYMLVTEVVEQESEDKYTPYTKHTRTCTCTRTRTMLGDVCPSSADKVYFCVTCDVQLRWMKKHRTTECVLPSQPCLDHQIAFYDEGCLFSYIYLAYNHWLIFLEAATDELFFFRESLHRFPCDWLHILHFHHQ